MKTKIYVTGNSSTQSLDKLMEIPKAVIEINTREIIVWLNKKKLLLINGFPNNSHGSTQKNSHV